MLLSIHNKLHNVNCDSKKLSIFSYCIVSVFLSFYRSQGVYFLNTNKDPPYARGVLPEFTLSDNETAVEDEPLESI